MDKSTGTPPSLEEKKVTPMEFKMKPMKGIFLVWTANEIYWSHLVKLVQFPSASKSDFFKGCFR